MDSSAIPLFAPAALAVLDRQQYDPAAKGKYEVMSGGLIWGDEFPKPGTPEREQVMLNWVYRYLIAYRASIALGEERAEFRLVWEQVVSEAPSWPGLRPERWGAKARKRLLAAKRREAVCFEELEKQLASGSSHEGEHE